jgi:hypothetical protein
MKKAIYTIVCIAMLGSCAKVTQEAAPCTGPAPAAPQVPNQVIQQGYTNYANDLTYQQGTTIIFTGPNNYVQTSTNGQLYLDFSSTTNYGLYTATARLNGCSSTPDTFMVTANPIPVPPPCTISPANYNILSLNNGTSFSLTPGVYSSSSYYCYNINGDINTTTIDGVYTFDLGTLSYSITSGSSFQLVSSCSNLLNTSQAFATISLNGTILYQSYSGNVYCNTIGGQTYITFCSAIFKKVSNNSSVTLSGNLQYQ